MKVSIIIPIYYNEENLVPLYNDIKEKSIDKISYDEDTLSLNEYTNFLISDAVL